MTRNGREGSDDRPAMEIQAVARTRAHEEVARQLREQIQRGALRPGDRLPPERELAHRFQVSRATVRHALSSLQTTGLVESRIGEGTFARTDKGPSVTDLATALRTADATLTDQLGLRRLIEPQVAQLAAEHAQEADLAELRRCVALQEARFRDGEPFIDEDSAFHLAIARGSGNALLVQMVEGIHELLKDSRERSMLAPGGMESSLTGHRQILEAISRGDGDATYDAMLAHIQDVERLSLQTLTREGSDEPS